MPYADPTKRRQVQRDSARRRRAALRARATIDPNTSTPTEPVTVDTIVALQDSLGRALAETLADAPGAIGRARAVAGLIREARGLIEAGELAERLGALEARMDL